MTMKINIRNVIFPLYFVVIATIFPLSLEARTLGNYISLDISHLEVESDIDYVNSSGTRTIDQSSALTPDTYPRAESSEIMAGLEISKALRLTYFSILDIDLYDSDTLDDIYVSAGLFYDRLNYNNYANDRHNISITSRYGVNLGLGYDITDYLAVYGNAGYASVNYEIDSRSFTHPVTSDNNSTDNNRAISPIMALGINFNITEDFLLGFKYSSQKINLKSQSYSTDSNFTGYDSFRFATTLATYGLRLSKRF